MSESEHHRDLVRALAEEIASDPSWSIPPILYCDIQDGFSGAVPPVAGLNRPDVLARDISTSRAVIGEAKTAQDIDNQHTFEQLASYFGYLRAQAEGELWMGVPWLSAGMAIRVSTLARKRTNSLGIPIRVVAFMIGATTMRRIWRE